MRGTTTKRSSLALVAGVVAALTVVVGVVLLADMRAEAQDETLQHETKFTFFNDTATVASDLHLAFGEPVKAVVVDVIGSTCPPIAASDIPAGPIIDIDWGVKCVENDGLTSVSVTVLSAGEEDPAHPEVLWTKDASITPEPTPTGATPTDVIPLPSLPPSTATDIGPPPTIPITTQVPPVHTATPTTPSSGPTSTVGPTATPTATPHTPTPTATSTPTATNTVMPTITPTPTLVPGNGDVSCNGNVDAIDAALLLQHIARLLATLQCQFAADVNQNGVIDSIDAALLLQFVAHLIPSLPTGP